MKVSLSDFAGDVCCLGWEVDAFVLSGCRSAG